MYKVLIIDDEKPVRTAIATLIKRGHFGLDTPATAFNGMEGLNAMYELHPDIVFVDIRMPVMNGIQFLQNAFREFSDVKYLVVSGYDDFYYAQSAIKNGAIDYLLKPIVAEEFENSMKKAINMLNKERHIQNNRSANKEIIFPNESIENIKNYIDKHYSEKIIISMFCEKYFYTKGYLSRLFKKRYGLGIYKYAINLRMERAKVLLLNRDLQIQEISYRLGYNDNNYFSKAFKKYSNQSPSEYRKGIKKK